jgi:predicted AAA+ superfamily ATPase
LYFLHLRRKYTGLYYFDEKGECDFIAMKNGVVAELVQVCYELTPDNVKRELNGLYKAMRFFNRQNAKNVTFANTDSFTEGDFSVEAIPDYQYLVT